MPPNCRPECTISAECSSDKSCIQEKCIDPCPGSCGFGALCNVINHTPICTCPENFIGDPFASCQFSPSPRKIIFLDNNYFCLLRIVFTTQKNQSKMILAIHRLAAQMLYVMTANVRAYRIIKEIRILNAGLNVF